MNLKKKIIVPRANSSVILYFYFKKVLINSLTYQITKKTEKP